MPSSLPNNIKVDVDPAKKGSLARRILAGMGALMAGQALTILIQLVSLPSFLRVWDVGTYGRWLMISTIPSYLSMADGGLLAVTSNEVTMLHARGELQRANGTFQSALAMVLTLVVGGAALSAVVFTLMPESWLSQDLRLGTWFLVMLTLLGLFGGLLDASFRAHGRFALGVNLGNATRLIEFLGMLIGLFWGKTFASTAAGMLCARALCTGLQVAYCARHFPALKWSVREARWATLRPLFQPGMGYLAFPLGNVLSLQSMTLIVGTAFSPAAAAVFNTYRTISRLAIQTTSIFGHALWAEFSKLYGRSALAELDSLYRKSERLGCILSVVCAALIFPIAPFVLKVWTHDKIAFDATVFACFCVATLLGSLAHVPRGLLMSTNQHLSLAKVYVVCAALGAGVSFALGSRLGLSGAVLASMIADAGLLVAAWLMARKLVKSFGNGMPDSST